MVVLPSARRVSDFESVLGICGVTLVGMGDRQIDVDRSHQAVASGREARFNRDLGANVRAARVAAGLTQEGLADKVGVTRGSIANLERGAQAPTAYRLITIAEALGAETAVLLPAAREDISNHLHELTDTHRNDVHRVLQRRGVRA